MVAPQSEARWSTGLKIKKVLYVCGSVGSGDLYRYKPLHCDCPGLRNVAKYLRISGFNVKEECRL
jgi:hypothetical protein